MSEKVLKAADLDHAIHMETSEVRWYDHSIRKARRDIFDDQEVVAIEADVILTEWGGRIPVLSIYCGDRTY